MADQKKPGQIQGWEGQGRKPYPLGAAKHVESLRSGSKPLNSDPGDARRASMDASTSRLQTDTPVVEIKAPRELCSEFTGPEVVIALRDESGRVWGHVKGEFVPSDSLWEEAITIHREKYTTEELDRLHAAPGGRTLDEIFQELGIKRSDLPTLPRDHS